MISYNISHDKSFFYNFIFITVKDHRKTEKQAKQNPFYILHLLLNKKYNCSKKGWYHKFTFNLPYRVWNCMAISLSSWGIKEDNNIENGAWSTGLFGCFVPLDVDYSSSIISYIVIHYLDYWFFLVHVDRTFSSNMTPNCSWIQTCLAIPCW